MRVGIDLIKTERFKNKSNSFFEKYFSADEISYAKSRKIFDETIAGLFACKEAFLKALGIGVFKGIKLKDVCILHDEHGAPFLEISKTVKQKFKINECSVSISHDSGFCTAICIIN